MDTSAAMEILEQLKKELDALGLSPEVIDRIVKALRGATR